MSSEPLRPWLDGVSEADLSEIAARLGVTVEALRNGSQEMQMDAAGILAELSAERAGFVPKEKAAWAAAQFER